MFEGKGLLQIIAMGGIAMYVLIACSVISLAVILERWITYRRKARLDRPKFMARIREELSQGAVERALQLCDANPAPLSAVVKAGIKKAGHEEKEISSAMERTIMIETVDLEKYTGIVGTIGNVAVYIGLFGTVLGIVRSFHNISQVGAGGISVVIGGVSEALLATATGLMVAIPAVVAYNYFVRRVDYFVTQMEYCASETLDMLTAGKKA